MQNVCPPNTSQYAFSSNCKNVIAAWSGGIADTARNRMIIWGGGHVDYYGNEVYSLDLNSQSLVRLNNPGPVADPNANASTLSDGTPNSRHTYDGLAYIAHADRMFAFSGSLASNSGNADALTWTLNLATLQWQNMNPGGSGPRAAFGVVADYDPNTRNVFVHDTYDFFQYNYDTNTYTHLNSFGIDYHDTAVIDPGRKLFIMMGGDFHVVSIAPGSNYQDQDWSTQSSGCSGLFNTASPGLAYDSVQKLIVGWTGGDTVYLLNPDTKSCTTKTFSNGPGASQQWGTFGRFRYLPSINAFAVVNGASENAYLLRLTSGTGTTAPTGPTISGTNATPTSSGATITWNTDVAATSQVEYGTTTSYGTLTSLDSTLATIHSVALTGLATGTTYHYRVHSKNSAGTESISGDLTFTTTSGSPPPPTSGTTHVDFNYADRTSLLNAGWSYTATTAAGGARNTEQLSGAL
ncbi:MAG TPA: fibronectin type III domain-containing protein, partial [Terriglobales bacterium]